MNAIMSPRAQLYLAWVLLVGSLIGWPVSQLTVAANEPPFVLGLSWFAIVLGAWNTIVTTQVNKDTDALSPKSLEQIEAVVTRVVAQGYAQRGRS